MQRMVESLLLTLRKSMPSKTFSTRLYILIITILCLMGIVVARLFYVQVIDQNKYEQDGLSQYQKSAKEVFERGSIFLTTKDGERVSGATVMRGYRLVLNTNKIVDAEATYEALTPYLSIEKEVFINRAKKVNDPYEEVATRLSKEEAEVIKSLALPGVFLENESWRFYPGERMASRILGFVAYKDDDLTGRYGLEQKYNDVLSRDKDAFFVNFFAEIFSSLHDVVFEQEGREGDIVTSIEPTVQRELEATLYGVRNSWNSDIAGGIVMDPSTGRIYAMSVMPDFDVNNFREVKDPSTFGNPLVEGVYEFGSIFKTLTMAVGIETGVVTPETTYDDKGSVTLNKKTINNWDGKARGVVSMQQVLNQSLNTGATFIYQKVGKENFRKYFYDFGIKEKSGVDLPGEVSNMVSNLESTRDVEYATASFGQGIALTPVSAARAFSAIANGGTLVEPHLVTEILYRDGSEKRVEPEPGPQIISKETSLTVARMMTNVLDEGLSGGKYKLPNHSLAVKGGTAQMISADGRGYEENKYLHSMYGFLPAYDPKFLIFVFHTNPKGATYSSETWPRPFTDFAKFLVSYYNIPPDR